MKVHTPTHRWLATAAGITIVAAVTHYSILKTGGYALDTPAPLFGALALGIIAAARAIGSGKVSGVMASGLVIALLAGEAYNFASTLDRQIETAEDAQAPIRAKHTKRAEALKALAETKAAAPSTQRLTLAARAVADAKAQTETPRVRIAREAVKEAKAAVDAEAQNIGCRKECWRKQEEQTKAEGELQSALAEAAKVSASAVTKAEAELAAALAEAEAVKAEAVKAAEARVEANPEPRSATPTADRIGMEPWLWDLLKAALLSVAANFLAAMLLALGSKPELEPASRPDATGSSQTSFPVDALATGTNGTTVQEFLAGVPGSTPVPHWGPKVPPTTPGGSGPKGGTRKARSEPQRRADLIAKELRDRGEVPKFHIVRNEYAKRYGAELPKVTAHRACG